MKNEYRGESYPVHPAPRTTMTKAQDPCHSGWCVDEQLKNKSGGFVSNFSQLLAQTIGRISLACPQQLDGNGRQ
jgi:hypothetical protein